MKLDCPQNFMAQQFYTFIFLSFLLCFSGTVNSQELNKLTLKNYRPVSIYKIPKIKIEKAKYPVVMD